MIFGRSPYGFTELLSHWRGVLCEGVRDTVASPRPPHLLAGRLLELDLDYKEHIEGTSITSTFGRQEANFVILELP